MQYLAGLWDVDSLSGSGCGSRGFKCPFLIKTPKAVDRGVYSGVKVLWPLGAYLGVCELLPDAQVNGVAVRVFGVVVVTIPISEVLPAAALLVPAFVLRLNALLGCSLS